MAFQFDPELYRGKAREKYVKAEKRINKIHNKFPEIERADAYLNYLKREYHYLKVGVFNNKKKSSKEIADLKEEIKELEAHFISLLDRHNIPHDYKEPDWDCPKCQDQGRIYKDGRYYICSCAIGKQIKQARLKGNLPKHLHNSTFKEADLTYYDSDETTDRGKTYQENASLVYSYARNFADSFTPGEYQRGLTIYGPVGSGKSFLLGCIANHLVMRGIDFKYIIYTNLLQEIRNSFQDNTSSEKAIINEVQEVPVLLIDDLGTENTSEFTASLLYQIIDKRYMEEKPIIITTNYLIDDLMFRFEEMMEEMGQRIFQRLMEMNNYLCLYGNVRDKIVRERQEGKS